MSRGVVETCLTCLRVPFFILVFHIIGVLQLFAEVDFSVKGNSLFASFLGRNNYWMFAIRNLELEAKGSRGYFFLKGSFDVNPYTLSFFTESIAVEQTSVRDFFSTPSRTLYSADTIEDIIRIKELFVSTRGLPFVRVTMGRFYGAIGNLNQEKFWDRWFVERPFTIRNFFGIDGFLDEGLEISLFPPLPWSLEFIYQVFDGSEKPWGSRGSFEFVNLISIRNTFGQEPVNGGFGLFWCTGKNNSADRLDSKGTAIVSPAENFTEFFGGDAFFNFGEIFSARVGYIIKRESIPQILRVEGGLFSEFVVRPIDFFAAGIRPEIFGIPRNVFPEGGGVVSRPQIADISISATFLPTDYVRLRLQWTGNFSEAALPQNIFYLQAMFNLF